MSGTGKTGTTVMFNWSTVNTPPWLNLAHSSSPVTLQTLISLKKFVIGMKMSYQRSQRNHPVPDFRTISIIILHISDSFKFIMIMHHNRFPYS